MDKKLRKRCEKLNKQNKFGEIITLIEALPIAERDYEAASQLARAYNNKGRYQEALDLLLPLGEQGKDDPLWHFRLGYAYDHLSQAKEALAAFEQVLALNPRDWEARLYVRSCRKKLKGAKAHGEGEPLTHSDDE